MPLKETMPPHEVGADFYLDQRDSTVRLMKECNNSFVGHHKLMQVDYIPHFAPDLGHGDHAPRHSLRIHSTELPEFGDDDRVLSRNQGSFERTCRVSRD